MAWGYSAEDLLSGLDDVQARPAWLRPFALVEGTISSAPLDLAGRMDRLYQGLKARGWLVAVRSIGTDFAGPGGVPVPRDQPIQLYLHRRDRPYTAEEAAQALAVELERLALGYSPLRAWLGELSREVAQPTIQQAAAGLQSFVVPALVGGLVALVVLRR